MAVEQALAQIEADAVLYHSFVHGAAGSVVTEGGSILNMAMQAYHSDQKVLQLSIFNPRGAWVTGSVYAFRDIVTESSVNYMVLTGHTAGTFATDLAAGRLAIHQDPTAAILQAALARELEGEGVDFVARAKKNVATVDDLDNTPPGTHENVYARCFETIGDGGFGEFEWIAESTATPVRGMVHQVTGLATGRWVRQTNGIIDVKMFGVKEDGTDDLINLRKAFYATNSGDTVIIGSLTISEGIFIDKPLKIKARGPVAEIEQLTWGMPCFALNAIDNVEFSGTFSFVNNQTRTYPIPHVTATDPLFDAFYDLYTGSERIVSTGVIVRGKADNFKMDDVYSRGFFCGITIVGANSNTTLDSENVRLGVVHVTDTDWGIITGGGFKNMTIEGIIGENITYISTADPSHCIYIGPRPDGVYYEGLEIGFINLNSAQLSTGGLVMADAFSVRNVRNAHIGTVRVNNAQYVGNAYLSTNLVIDNLFADTVETVPSSSIGGMLNVATNAKIKIMNGECTFRNAVGNGSGAYITDTCFYAASTGSIEIVAGTYRLSAAEPGNFVVFGGKNLTIGKDVKIIYDNPISVNTPAISAYPIYISVIGGDYAIVNSPTLIGETRLLCLNSGTPADGDQLFLTIDPNKILSGMNALSVYDSTTKYSIIWEGFAKNPTIFPVLDATVDLQGSNTFITANTENFALSGFARGSKNQRYLFISGEAFTEITHGNFAGGFVAKGGASLARGTWTAVEAVWITDRLYETQRY